MAFLLMNLKSTVCILSVGLLLITGGSCNRVKKKADELKEAAVDKIFRPFDAGKPDTDHNKKRFSEFFGFAPGNDVDSLYCFGDEMGIDSKYQFAFRCNAETAARIKDSLNIYATARDTTNEILTMFTVTQSWWPDSLLAETEPDLRLGGGRDYHYWWYFPKTRWAYYHTFDL